MTGKSKIPSEVMTLEVDAKGYVSEADRDHFLKKFRYKLENRTCFDCCGRNNTWISTSYAIFLCLNCSANHRRMGTHISFVRSCDLDKFTREQLRRIEIGGNSRARNFFKSRGLLDGKHVDYYSKIAQKYRSTLEKEIHSERNALSTDTPPTIVRHESRSGCCDADLHNNLVVNQNDSDGWGVDTFERHPKTPHNNDTSQNVVEALKSISDHIATTTTTSGSNGAGCKSEGRPLVTSGVGKASTANNLAGRPPQLKAKKMDFNFDFEKAVADDIFFDAAPQLEQSPYAANSQTNSNFMTSATFSSSLSSHTAGQLKPASAPVSPTASSAVPESECRRDAYNLANKSRFTNSKAISSADFFAQNADVSTKDSLVNETRYCKFDNARAISSTSFFSDYPDTGTARSARSRPLEDETVEQLANLTDQARESISNVTRGAQNVYSSAKSWINYQLNV